MAAAIPMVIGAVAGGIQGDQERSATRRQNIAAAEANKYADVTGFRQKLKPQGGGTFGGALKGASTFGALGSQLGGGNAASMKQGFEDVGGAGQMMGSNQFGGGGLAQNTRRPGGSFGALGGGIPS